MEFLIALALTTATLAVPQHSNANASVAADGEFAVVAWSASADTGATDIVAAVSTDGGRTFGPPVQVNDKPGDARVNGEQPPRVSLVRRPRGTPAIVVVWTTKGEAGTTLLQARSDDGGRSFSASAVVPGTDAPGNRGWEAIAAGGTVVDAVWLDHRELAQGEAQMSTMHHAMQAAKPDGVAMAQRSKLYFAALDGSVPPRALTGGVCYCCKTALVIGRGGAVYTAWRHVYPGNIRDIAFAQSHDGGRTFSAPMRVSEDRWVLEGCPDDGPAMTLVRQQRIHIVWPTLVQESGKDAEPNLALFHAMSVDGRMFTARARIPTEGTPHHPQLALDHEGRVVVVWDELTGGKRRIAFARAAAAESGPLKFARQILSGAAPGVYPAVAAVTDGTVVVWTSSAPSGSAIHVVRVPQGARP
jgi:hypothetical protein